jgi:hypothetical protein
MCVLLFFFNNIICYANANMQRAHTPAIRRPLRSPLRSPLPLIRLASPLSPRTQVWAYGLRRTAHAPRAPRHTPRAARTTDHRPPTVFFANSS